MGPSLRSGVLLVLLASACGGSSIDTVTVLGRGGASSGGGAPSSGAAGTALQAGASASGGAATSNGGDGHSSACATPADCVANADQPCMYAMCVAGVCGSNAVAQGTFVGFGTPGDCMALRCDGDGNTQEFVEPTDVLPSAVCERNECGLDGTPSSEPVASGAACASKSGGKYCDGAGNCVACVEDADCANGEVCSQGVCTVGLSAPSCADGQEDGTETDIDCGGSCPPCAVTKDCYADTDCVSKACDAWAPHRCLSNHCNDHRTDGDESDVDCGGSCAVCTADRHCLANTDCDSGVCDFARVSFCLPKFCVDGQLDHGETDVDCGGGQCDGCALGKSCSSYFDCASRACDQLTHQCIADHCLDHVTDDGETDADCGGMTTCARCALFERCLAGSDCASGECSTSVPHVCE